MSKIGDEDVRCFARAVYQCCKPFLISIVNFKTCSWELECLVAALSTEHCKLETLDLRRCRFPSGGQKMLVGALEQNFKLCSLMCKWETSALRARASVLLKRNQFLKQGGLLEQPQVKPHSAKLFICGHERVGKTTLRKKLHRANTASAVPMLSNPLRSLRTSEEPPTRGMELHTLPLGELELVVCDLAGQKEYHTFHLFLATRSITLSITSSSLVATGTSSLWCANGLSKQINKTSNSSSGTSSDSLSLIELLILQLWDDAIGAFHTSEYLKQFVDYVKDEDEARKMKNFIDKLQNSLKKVMQLEASSSTTDIQEEIDG